MRFIQRCGDYIRWEVTAKMYKRLFLVSALLIGFLTNSIALGADNNNNNNAPVVGITTSGNKSVWQDTGTLSITGTVRDSDNDVVTISATIGGVTKSTIISDTVSSKIWTLNWSGAELPIGVYSGIVFIADDGKDPLYKNYSGTITIRSRDYYLWSKYEVDGATRGALIESGIRAIQGTYPDNGIHTDGYWYVKNGLAPNNPPSGTVNQNDIVVVSSQGTLTLTGTAQDPDNDVLLIEAEIAGIKAQTAVANTTTSKLWTLTWKNNEIPDGIYTNIPVTISDGK